MADDENTQQQHDYESADDEWTSGEKTCPECGVPIENLRKTCPNCGHEYSDEDYDQKDAGTEFIAGSEVDEEGKETGGGGV